VPPNARVGKDIVLVGAAAGEFRNHRALRSRLEPMEDIGKNRELLSGPKHDFVEDGVILFCCIWNPGANVRRCRRANNMIRIAISDYRTLARFSLFTAESFE
jgi:hypothetical protein